jgi:hypothetical protein
MPINNSTGARIKLYPLQCISQAAASSAQLGLAAGITQKLKRPYQINRLENKHWVTALAAQSNPTVFQTAFL